MSTTIQFFYQGVEYTTRHELAQKYPELTYNRLQRILERPALTYVQYKNQFYFHKEEIERLIEGLLKK
jgi:hypothetical protein